MSVPRELTVEEKAKLKAAFDHVDSDHDGKINTPDLKAVFTEMGLQPTNEQVKNFMEAADSDNSGFIDFEEFSVAVITVAIIIRVAMFLQQAFAAMDTDGSGFVTKDELKKLVADNGAQEQFPDKKVDAIFAKMDEAGDGKVSFDEFVNAALQYVEEQA